jgi:hypothetical protein
MDMGMISDDTDALATAIPPTADVTDTAGVRIPSAIVKLVPKRHYKPKSVAAPMGKEPNAPI